MTDKEVCNVRVRMDVSQRERLREVAQESGLTMADVVRSLVPEPSNELPGVQVVVSPPLHHKLRELADGSGLTVSEALSALIHEATQVRFMPGHLACQQGRH